MPPNSDWEKVVAVAVPSGIVSLSVGVISGVVQRRYGGFWCWFRALLSALVVGTTVGLFVDSSSLSAPTRTAVVIICAFVAGDLLEGLLQLSAMFRADPIGLFKRFKIAIRGEKP